MALHLACAIPARIVRVLKDYLPAELDLIDASMADGITTPDVPDATGYHQWEPGLLVDVPACLIRVVSSTPLPVAGTYPAGFGARGDFLHRFDVMFRVSRPDAATAGSDSPLGMQALLMRYIAGAYRVLCIQKAQLETAADPVAWASEVRMAGSADYGPQPGEAEGTVQRTATLPIDVRLIEAR